MSYEVQHSPGAARQIRGLARQPAFAACLAEALDVLEQDPYNRSRQHNILKLAAPPREQPRFRLRRFGFLYIVFDQKKAVLLVDVSLRREDTYR